MKYVIILCGFLSGCATIGDIEGLGEFVEFLRAAETTRVLLGGNPQRHNTAPFVNRTQGEIKSLIEKQDRLEVQNLPHTIEQILYIRENTRSVGEDLGK